MFKVSLIRDILNHDATKRNKVTGVDITYGYTCQRAHECDCGEKCKYRKYCKFHNWSVAFHRFFEYRLHTKLPHLLYIKKSYTDLSGTTKCPFNKPRMYSCCDCKFNAGYMCSNENYIKSKYEEYRIPGQSYCKFLKKTSGLMIGIEIQVKEFEINLINGKENI